MKKTAALLAAVMIMATPASAASNLYISAEFDNEAVDYGVNKFTVFGENNTNESKTFRIFNTVTENGKLIGAYDGGSVTVAQGNTFTKSGSVTVPETADIGNTKVDVYLWDGATGNSPISQEISSKSVKFKYTLEEDAKTSAAVYDKTGKLVRTLWSVEQSYAGENFGIWDGTDDAGNIMPAGSYEVKVLSNNVEYTMDSIVGNNTTGTKLSTMHSNYDTISDMALLGNKMYFAEQYTEGVSACRYFDISNPREVAGYFEKNNTRINNRVVTDGKYVYWMTVQPTPVAGQTGTDFTTVTRNKECFIYATDPTAPSHGFWNKDGSVTFPAGVQKYDIWNVRNMFNAIGVVTYAENNNNAYNLAEFGYGDLAVQKNGDFLVACYGSCDFIRVINKTTGATLKDNPITEPRALAIDNDGKLWAAFKESDSYVVKRFTINSDGSLTVDLTAPASVGFGRGIALAVSPNGTQLAVAYGDDHNKVVAYNISDWSTAWSYGSGVSYKTDPAVYDNKLLFKQAGSLINGAVVKSDDEYNLYTSTFIEYEDDNTVWIGDQGNYRSLKVQLSGSNTTLVDAIYSPKQSYCMSADANDPKRVFLAKHEYEIDYSKTGSDAWKLKNNWFYESDKLVVNTNYVMQAITTLSNGRTYFVGIDSTDNQRKIFELEEKTIRNTGIVVDGHMLMDGSFAINKMVKEKQDGVVGQAIYRKYVTGFDSSNNPIYGEAVKVGFIPNSLGKTTTERTEITESGKLIHLGNSNKTIKDEANPAGMRVSAYDVNSNTGEFVWQTAPETYSNYMLDMPKNGYFDIGGVPWNTVHFQPQIFGDNIIFAYTGEGYKKGQTEIFFHIHESGLVVGVYGNAGYQIQSKYEDFGEALTNGNGFNWNTVFPDRNDSDTAYIYQAGEARISGLVRFKVTGLNSIKTQSVNISLGSNLRNGLTAEAFDGTEYLITNTIKRTAKDKVEVLNGGEGLANYGIRYTGYITKPEKAGKPVKIWVYSDGNATLKISGVEKASGSGMIGTSLVMKDGESYKIELIVTNDDKNITNVQMFYEADGEFKEYPMANLLTENLGNESIVKTIDLLGNLPENSTFTENACGWNFGDMIINAGESQLNAGTYESKVLTNYAKYDYRDNPDLDIKMVLYKDQNTSIERNLGNAMENINEWEISSEVMFLGKLSGWHTGSIPGEERRYIDILDENGKIIARVEPKMDYAIYGNDKMIYQAEVPAKYEEISINYLHEFALFNPLKIRCVEGNVTFEYKNGTISTGLFDSSANWKKPAKIKVYASKSSRQDPYADSYETIFGELEYTQRAKTDTHLVTFYSDDRTTVLKRENVENGGSATAPNANKTGFTLSWSTSFNNVTSNINVYAIYTPDATERTVSFYDEDGTFISSTKAVFETLATAPSVSKEGYKFLGWFTAGGEQVDLAAIAADISVYAKYQRTGTYTETFDNFTVDYTNQNVSGNTFGLTASANLYTDNSYDSGKVMSVKEVAGKDGNTTKALYINPYKSANGEEYSINFGEIRTGKVAISFDYMVTDYALSTSFNYFGTLRNSSSGQMAACMTQIRSFGSSNPFASTTLGAIRRVDKIMDENGKYSSYTDVSTDKNWHSLKYDIDMDAKSYTLIVDGTTIGTYGFYDNVSYIDTLYFKGLNYNAAQNMGRYYIDNIQVEYKS